jgi:hypothetical protein
MMIAWLCGLSTIGWIVLRELSSTNRHDGIDESRINTGI